MRLRGEFLAIFLLLRPTEQRSSLQDDHYIAAVVEYGVNKDVEQNRLQYIQFIADAAQQNADVVVFPELTLTNASVSFAVPFRGLLKEYPIPALHPELYDELLVSMSAAARQNQIYVLFNTRELVDCTRNDTGEECPELKQYIFNTNVVLDRTGAVIDRYRKINLFGEYSHTPALHPDLGLFTTDFGVTFGHFICFDLMFQVPAIQVVQKHQITDVIFSTMWFSELPYLTAVQIQEAYAYALNINFLASGANRPAVGSAGSGIYSGKAGALISIMPGVPTTRLLVAKVPKVPGQVTEPIPGPIYDDPSVQDGLHLNTDSSLPSHVSRELVDGHNEFVLKDKDVSCTFRVRLTHASGAQALRYRAVVHDGSNTYARREVGIASCLLLACKDDNIKSCSHKFDKNSTETRIEDLEIEMSSYQHQYNKTLKCDDVIYFPLSFQTNKFPLSREDVSYSESTHSKKPYNRYSDKSMHVIPLSKDNDIEINETDLENCAADTRNDALKSPNIESIEYNENFLLNRITYKIKKPQDGIVAFGIWGRIYNKDVDHRGPVTEEDMKIYHTILDTIYAT